MIDHNELNVKTDNSICNDVGEGEDDSIKNNVVVTRDIDNSAEQAAISEVKKFLMDDQVSTFATKGDVYKNVDRVSVEHLNYSYIGNSSVNIDWILDEILNITPKLSVSDGKSLKTENSSTPINQTRVDECFSCFQLSPILKQMSNEAELSAIAAKFLSDSQEEFSCMNITEVNFEDYNVKSKSAPSKRVLKTTKKLATNNSVARNEEEGAEDEVRPELPIYCEKCACIIPDDVLKCSGCRNCYHRACCTESNVSEDVEENSQTLPNRWRCERCNRFTVYASKTTIFKSHLSSSTTPRVLMGSADSGRPKIKSKKLDRTPNAENTQSKLIPAENDGEEGRKVDGHDTPSDICLFCRMNNADFSKSAYCDTKCLKKMLDKLHDHFDHDLDARVNLIDCQTRKIMSGSSAPKLKNIPAYLETHRKYFPRVFSTETADSTKKTSKKKKKIITSSETTTQKTTTPPSSESTIVSNITARPMANDAPAVNENNVKKSKVEKEKWKSNEQKKKTGQIQPQAVNASYKVDHVRILVRQHLRDCLFDRLKHCDDILLSKDELNPIAIDIEKAMFVANKEEVHSAPYKQQFKALLVNLKEQNNQGFFRRILNGTLSPHKVATMSGQEMASRENSQWSTPGSKAGTLDCTDSASTSKLENLSSVDTSEKSMERTNSAGESQKTSADDVVASTFAVISNNSEAKSSRTFSKRRIEDTTMEHKSHLFDLNCKVCAGKMTKKQYLELTSTAKRPKIGVVDNATNNNNQVGEIPPQEQRPPDHYQHHRRSIEYEENAERHSVPSSIRNAQPSTPENAPFMRPLSSNDNFRPSSSSSSRPVLLSPPTLIFAPVDDSDVNFAHSAILNVDSFVQPSPPPITRRPPTTSPLRNVSPFAAAAGGGQRLLPPVARIPPIQNNFPTTPVLSAETPKTGFEWRQMTPSSSSSTTSAATQIGVIRMPPVFDSTVFVQGAEMGLVSLPPPPMPPPVPDYLKDGHGSGANKPVDPRLSPQKLPASSAMGGASIEPSPPLFDEYVWRGVLDMPGYYRFNSAFVGVSGSFEFLSRELPNHLRIVGRITKETVYDYVKNLKGDNTKDVVVVRLIEPSDIQQKAQYHGLLGNMVLKEKFSVVETSKLNRVKDLYLLPLQRNEQPDDVLLPFDGPGLPNPRSEMIMAIIVRRRERVEHAENENDPAH